MTSCTRELWKKDTINLEKEQKSSLNQQLNISRKNLVLIRNTVTQTIANLHLWNWTLLSNVKKRILEKSKITNLKKRAIHVANRATSQEIADRETWWIAGRSMLCWERYLIARTTSRSKSTQERTPPRLNRTTTTI